MLGISSLVAIATCTANDHLRLCHTELTVLADTLQLSLDQHPEWSSLFQVDGVSATHTLYTLAERFRDKFTECPCVGECTETT
jgi:hypothetical protein